MKDKPIWKKGDVVALIDNAYGNVYVWTEDEVANLVNRLNDTLENNND